MNQPSLTPGQLTSPPARGGMWLLADHLADAQLAEPLRFCAGTGAAAKLERRLGPQANGRTHGRVPDGDPLEMRDSNPDLLHATRLCEARRQARRLPRSRQPCYSLTPSMRTRHPQSASDALCGLRAVQATYRTPGGASYSPLSGADGSPLGSPGEPQPDLRIDDLVLAFGKNGLHEVAVFICGLRRERQLDQAGPVRLASWSRRDSSTSSGMRRGRRGRALCRRCRADAEGLAAPYA
jgi:hypothetical protein